ncbi:RAD54-like protein [Reticulomyxa filosa]|uniref:RAD54-like protein n=1 Tax=Reticulomyxa filosa TaxID=46433 RepID=X6MQ64_RETFI|nr:RAD54-like protein [Reticulomyxa filosa]|eukprot:ETO15974.1 RAD54-like protein [Reticulomyxa filosa]
MVDGIMAESKCKDKIVIVSNFTCVLDAIVEMIHHESRGNKKYPFLRLDGSVKQSDRIKLVEQFNFHSNFNDTKLFLITSKAGGVGLNLIGANHLIMCDPDWNPATDKQAMARIWRDGQSKPCKIYRLITIGTIEEKILQRQINKLELKNSIIDRNTIEFNNNRHFSASELKSIFTLHHWSDLKDVGCHTLQCMESKLTQWKVIKNQDIIKLNLSLQQKKNPVATNINQSTSGNCKDNQVHVSALFGKRFDPSQINEWNIMECVISDDENNAHMSESDKTDTASDSGEELYDFGSLSDFEDATESTNICNEETLEKKESCITTSLVDAKKRKTKFEEDSSDEDETKSFHQDNSSLKEKQENISQAAEQFIEIRSKNFHNLKLTTIFNLFSSHQHILQASVCIGSNKKFSFPTVISSFC